MATHGNTLTNKKTFRKVSPQKLLAFFAMIALLLYIGVWNYFPIFYSLLGSFRKWMPNDNVFDFAGLENYKWLFSEPLFWESLRHTLFTTVSASFLTVALGLIIATIIYWLPRHRSFFRTSFFLPYITSTVAVAIVWKYGIYNTDNGVLNSILSIFGIPSQMFLLSEHQVIPSIIAQIVWKDFGYAVLIYFAGLNGIPSSFFEAATIDGATRFQIFRRIIIPLIKPTTVLLLITGMINYMQIFNQVILMTSQAGGMAQVGGPGTASYVIMLMIYQQGFINWNFGHAASIGYVLAFTILVFTIIQLRFSKMDWGY
ncbi:MAG: sugar ABC transporter permease [Ruminiclostridium sp.]|nr:sugar ABC transporter permease [Ruminiclostridium sp.]